MKVILGSKRYHCLARIGIFLVTIALITGMVGCGGTSTQYTLSISSTSGGNVTHPGIGTFTYPAGAVVLLEVEPDEGYGFTHWSGNVSTINDVNAVTTTITMNGHYFITANFGYGQFIRTWYDLDDTRDDLGGYYVLMNDLDSSTAGYTELASGVANQGKGWQPIGTYDTSFTGTFDGHGYAIKDLFINRPEEDMTGLFRCVGEGGFVKSVGVVEASVTSTMAVGGLVGFNEGGTVSNCYATGSINGYDAIGGLVGFNGEGTISNCYAMGMIAGGSMLGGLVGDNRGTVSNSYATGNINGYGEQIGGLVGSNYEEGTVSNCYAAGSVTGDVGVGGLLGVNFGGTVSDSYATGNVTGVGQWEDFIGGLVGDNYGTISNCYSTGNSTGKSAGGLVGNNGGTVINSYYSYDDVLINGENVITIGALFSADFEEWLASGKFLNVNARLSKEGAYYIINSVTDFKQLLAFGQNASLKFRLKSDLDMASEPNFYIPYLAGEFDGDGHEISNLSFSFSFVCGVGLFGHLSLGGELSDLGVENVNTTGRYEVGGLVGSNFGFVANSHASANVTGNINVGGLIGWNSDSGAVSSSYAISRVGGDYLIGGLAGQNSGAVSNSYAMGIVTSEGEYGTAGGLVGGNGGTIDNSYAAGNVTGTDWVGGLAGNNYGTVSNSYSTSNIIGNSTAGGLVGYNGGNVTNCYSVGSVTGNSSVGGLVGDTSGFGTVSNSFWDVETSGQATSGGGTGKNTTQMKDITTFSGATWNITTVANPSLRNISYIWNIVNNVTYPFLSWEPV
jgi:hypothetical protein